jgi:Tat protein secretion system quality control protein TatD with DNase activity
MPLHVRDGLNDCNHEGFHPWFAHTISLSSSDALDKESHYRALFQPSPSNEANFVSLLEKLPNPISLSTAISTLQAHLLSFPHALLGEVGLDRTFRVRLSPSDRLTATPFSTPLEHQLTILEAQLDLAVQFRRNVSMHSVRVPDETTALLARMHHRYDDRWRAISVDIHSCTLSTETWLEIEVACSPSPNCVPMLSLTFGHPFSKRKHTNVFFSLSTVINSPRPAYRALLQACTPTRILVESDFDNVTECGPRTWDMVRLIADIKGWKIEEDVWDEEEAKMKENEGHGEGWGVVRRLEMNSRKFLAGGHPPLSQGKNPKDKKVIGTPQG